MLSAHNKNFFYRSSSLLTCLWPSKVPEIKPEVQTLFKTIQDNIQSEDPQAQRQEESYRSRFFKFFNALQHGGSAYEVENLRWYALQNLNLPKKTCDTDTFQILQQLAMHQNKRFWFFYTTSASDILSDLGYGFCEKYISRSVLQKKDFNDKNARTVLSRNKVLFNDDMFLEIVKFLRHTEISSIFLLSKEFEGLFSVWHVNTSDVNLSDRYHVQKLLQSHLTKADNGEYNKNIRLKKVDLSHSTITDQELGFLIENFPCIESLDVSHCKNLTPGGLQQIAFLTKLSHLNVSYTLADDNWLNFIVQQLIRNQRSAPISLKSLNVSGCKALTGWSWRIIYSLPMQGLGLYECNILPASLVAIIDRNPHLESLEVGHENSESINEDVLSSISRLTNLKQLKIGQCNRTENGRHTYRIRGDGIFETIIHSNPNLEFLKCNNIFDYKALENCTMLRELDFGILAYLSFDTTHLTSETVNRIIQANPNLEKIPRIFISRMLESANFQENICRLSKLRHFNTLWRDGPTDDFLRRIVEACPHLQVIDLNGHTQLTKKGLMSLGKLRELVSLSMAACNVTDKILQAIVLANPDLQELNLNFCKKINPQGLVCLGQLKRLHKLSLQGTRLTDKILGDIITGTTALKDLMIECCYSITDRGLEHVSKLRYLRLFSFTPTSTFNGDSVVSIINNNPRIQRIIPIRPNLLDSNRPSSGNFQPFDSDKLPVRYPHVQFW